MRGFFLIIKAEIVRSFIIARRYWFRSLTGMVIGYGMLMVMIAGFMVSRDKVETALAGKFDDPTAATNFVLGFIIGMFAFSVVGMFTQGLQGMARTGVLEQLCMSPHGLITNFLARSVVGGVSTVLSSSLMVWLVTATVGGKLHFDPVSLPVLLLLTFINLLGFGYMMGGMVLVFKHVGEVALLIRMALFALAIMAREELMHSSFLLGAIMHALPITDAAICIKYVLIQDQVRVVNDVVTQVSVFRHESFYFLLASCVFWTATGMMCFKMMENWSRAKGTLGSY
ncbi:MAG: hypothetical protein HYV27_25340 [Candidatus Hydrogenedentes bacterium]|nr:hypothetical protein [Candidatus Hydrogenedentota bacterium]